MDQAQRDLWLYARTNKVEKLIEALNAGAKIDKADDGNRTALMHAAASLMVCPDTTKALLEHGANHALADTDGSTALMLAAWRGHLAVVSVLLEAGADPARKDRHDKTPLDHARKQGNQEIAELLRPLTPDPWEGADIDRLRRLDSDLCSAALAYIRKAEPAGMTGAIQSDDVPPGLTAIIPQWYALLLQSVPLAELSYESTRQGCRWPSGGWFRPIDELLRAYSEGFPEPEILEDGYFAFASSDDGNLWVIRVADSFEGPVFLWDLSGMEPHEAYPSFIQFLQGIQVPDSDA